jgi:uncharacterized membrane protein YdjX (TVP38/TMEM64 family)
VKKTPKTNKSSLLTIIAFVLTFGIIYYAGKNIGDMEKFIGSWGVAGPLVAVILFGVLSVTPVPTDPISAISGAMFGPVVGFLTSWAGNTLAALVEYFIGKGINSVTHFEDKKKNLPWGLSDAPVDSVWFLIGGRFVPGFGSKIVSFMAGVYGVNLWRYLWTTAAANVAGALLYALGGAKLIEYIKK